MTRRTIFLAVALLIAAPVRAQYDGGTESPFSLGAGSRDLSMGGANLALTDPTLAPFWNSSRLATAERFALTAFHSRLYEAGINYQYLGLVVPTLDFGSFGLGVFRHGVSDIDKRDASNLSLGSFGASQMRFYLSYGRQVSNINLGVSASVDYTSLDTYQSASSPGLDLSIGRAFKLNSEVVPSITAAINAVNLIRPSVKLDAESFSYSRAVASGVSVDLAPTKSLMHRIVLSASYRASDDAGGDLRVGAEYAGFEIFKVRFGVQGGEAAFGAGLSYGPFDFDYALVGRDYGSIQMFTLTSAFGKPASERRVQRAKKREEEFDRQMHARILEQNRALLAQLEAEGRAHLTGERFAEAVSSLDGALLLARSVDADTTTITELTREARTRLESSQRQASYAAHLDSASLRFTSADYLAARYFANLALEDVPKSDSARHLLQQSERALAGSSKTRAMIEKQVANVDSLLSQNRLEEAEAITKSLVEFAPTDGGVKLAVIKVEIERWRRALEALKAGEAPPAGLVTADSSRTQRQGNVKPGATGHVADTAVAPPPTVHVEPPSPVLAKEVESSYRAAQEAFGKGDLQKAIDEWERVERLIPGYRSTRSYLVRAYKFVGVELYAQKQRAEAVAAWKKAAKLDPADAELSDYIDHTETEIQKLKSLSYDPR